MGMTNMFTWKGLSLFATLDYRHGGYIYSNTKDYMHWTAVVRKRCTMTVNLFLVPNSVVSNGDGTYSENTVQVDPTALHTFYSNGNFRVSAGIYHQPFVSQAERCGCGLPATQVMVLQTGIERRSLCRSM